MRFLHVEAPRLGPFEDFDLVEELVVDTDSDVSLQSDFFRARDSPRPLAHLAASADGSTSEGVVSQRTAEIRARWLLTRE